MNTAGDSRLSLPEGDELAGQLRRMTRRGFAWGGAAALAGIAGWRWLVSRDEDGGQIWPLRRVLEFDERLAGTLDSMADRMEGKEVMMKENLEDSLKRLEQTTSTCCSELQREEPTAELQSFLSLSRRIELLTMAVDSEIQRGG